MKSKLENKSTFSESWLRNLLLKLLLLNFFGEKISLQQSKLEQISVNWASDLQNIQGSQV